MKSKSAVYWFEPVFYLFFGLFHLHRIWGLIDRNAYAGYWLGILTEKNIIYYVLSITLLALCINGIAVFIKNKGANYWWRWIYLFGGGYVLFDITAILFGISWWNGLLLFMFDTDNPLWNIIWGGFVCMGALSFSLGIYLIRMRKHMQNLRSA